MNNVLSLLWLQRQGFFFFFSGATSIFWTWPGREFDSNVVCLELQFASFKFASFQVLQSFCFGVRFCSGGESASQFHAIARNVHSQFLLLFSFVRSTSPFWLRSCFHVFKSFGLRNPIVLSATQSDLCTNKKTAHYKRDQKILPI